MRRRSAMRSVLALPGWLLAAQLGEQKHGLA